MRLCGISSRFQLLSPSTRQVTHALLTRPPLTFQSLGFMKSPFDLHVLGTPPAFILSQDQTLILKTRRVAADQLRWAGSSVVWSLKMNSLANLLKPFLLGFVLNFLKSKGPNQTFSFRIFRVLHTVQSLIFKVLCCSLSQTAHTFYHKLFYLSRTFFDFFKNFFFQKSFEN